MQKKTKLILWISLVVLILGILFYYTANHLAHKKVIRLLEEHRKDLPIENYEQIHINIWKGNFSILHGKLQWSDKKSGLIIKVDSERMVLKGFGLIKFWRKNSIDVKLLALQNAEIQLIEKEKTTKISTNHPTDEKNMPNIHLKQISFHNLSFVRYNKNGEKLTEFYMKNTLFQNLTITDWDHPHQWYKNLESYHIEVEKLFHKVTKWEALEIESILFTEETYEIKNLHFKTELDIKEYNNQLLQERDHYNIKIASINVSPTLWEKPTNRHRFFVPDIQLHNPDITIYRDKLLPDDTSYKPLFSQLLRELSFDIQTDKIEINQAKITYTERVQEQNDGGSVRFTNLNAMLTNVGNFKEVHAEKNLKIKVESDFMESGKLTADWQFNPQNTTDDFHFQAKISHLKASDVNAFTEPNLSVKFEGILDQVFLNIAGNKNHSKTDFAIAYHELKMALLRKDGKEKKKLLSAITNAFVKKESQTKERKLVEKKVEVTRDQTKSIFNFLWKNTLEGLKEATLKV